MTHPHRPPPHARTEAERPELYRNGKWSIRYNKHRYNNKHERYNVPYDIVHDDGATIEDAWYMEAAKARVDWLALIHPAATRHPARGD